MTDVRTVQTAQMMYVRSVISGFIYMSLREDAIVSAQKDSLEIILLESVKPVWSSVSNVQMSPCVRPVKVDIILQVSYVLMRLLFCMVHYLICQVLQATLQK